MKHNYNNRFEKIQKFLQKMRIPSKITFIVLGLVSTAWFLLRVIPKPSRAGYPCMRATAPWASAFVIYLVAISGSLFSFRKFKTNFEIARYPLASFFLVLTLGFSIISLTNNSSNSKAAGPDPLDPPNTPLGIAKGIFPGRVVWVYDPEATNENCTQAWGDGYFMDKNTNQDEVDKMLEIAVKKITGATSIAGSWDAIFRFHNQQRGKGDVGYNSSEIVFLKVNATSSWAGNINMTTLQRMNNSNYGISETSPQLVLSVLRQLVNVVGVPQNKIYIGDPMKNIYQDNYIKWHTEFPDVHYLDQSTSTLGREKVVKSTNTNARLEFSDRGTVLHEGSWNSAYDGNPITYDQLYTIFENMEYMINLPTLKGHERGGVTMFAKNHFGSHTRGDAKHLHGGLVKPTPSDPLRNTYGQYRTQVDLMTYKNLGKKTLIFLMDALFTSDMEVDRPDKWQIAPFNDDWTSSIFISQDPVAIESVGFDFLYAQYDGTRPDVTNGGVFDDIFDYPHYGAVDDYLHQAADSTKWPAGIIYDPENDGVSIGFSQGVHEHWNNVNDKKYTRNLGTGSGIELVPVYFEGSVITPDNSDILSEKVTTIYVDSFDVKWFGTDKGISRYDGIQWDTIDINGTVHLLNNNVKKIAYERTGFGHELWIATDGGLSVASFNIDGVTAATTYHKGNSGIINDTITTVGIDVIHNRWIGTKQGISTFKGSTWDSLKSYYDGDGAEFSLADVVINGIGSYEKDTQAYISTNGGGVLRYNHNDIDGFTGASTMDEKWSGFQSNALNCITVYDTIQYYGSEDGFYIHKGNECKQNWTYYTTAEGLVSNNVRAIEVDENGAIWIGTDQGLNIKNGKLWYTYSTIDGLVNPVINDIKKDFSGNIWIATNGGVEFFSVIPGRQTGGFEPIQAKNVFASNVTSSSADIFWTNGDDEKRIVFIKQGNDGVVAPVNNTSYNANTVFGLGSQIDGWSCIYNGTENSVNVAGLSYNTMYRVMVCEYSGTTGTEEYVTVEAVQNPSNFTTLNTGIFELSVKDIFEIYPNPFSNFIELKNDGSITDYKVSIYRLDGKLQYQEEISGKEAVINTTDLNTGIYILQITSGQDSYSYKVIKK